MDNQTNSEPHAPQRASPLETAALSLMAVQELLGLFREPQNHAQRVLKETGEPTTDLQAALEVKPLTYI